MDHLGSDISGTRDVDAALSVVSGRTALGQAILRRLTNPTGQGMPADRSYGWDLREAIGTTMTNGAIEQQVLSQVVAEEEVETASVEVVSRAAGQIQLSIEIEDGDGPFVLTVEANQLTVELWLQEN